MKVVSEGEGKRLNVLGDTLIVKLDSEDTAGAFAVMEAVTPPNAGPPVHLHRREDESFYVLEGEFEFVVDGQRLTAGPGAFLYAQRGTKHTFRNIGSKPGRMIVTVQPAGVEKFFAELDALPPGPPDQSQILPIFEKYGLEFHGPPLSAGS